MGDINISHLFLLLSEEIRISSLNLNMLVMFAYLVSPGDPFCPLPLQLPLWGHHVLIPYLFKVSAMSTESWVLWACMLINSLQNISVLHFERNMLESVFALIDSLLIKTKYYNVTEGHQNKAKSGYSLPLSLSQRNRGEKEEELRLVRVNTKLARNRIRLTCLRVELSWETALRIIMELHKIRV